jgi:DNA polymerase-3 subunit gamma/tau
LSYEVLARKWRPQQFGDVVGQDHVTRTLENAIKTGRLAHAFLFVGPRGTGKTSLARILAKSLNCGKGPTVTPCDACDACREIAAGRSFDVLEIDGASNNSVEQVRELRETVKYAPARGPFKIFIIDEVHMLSTSAFNALLKTLEEPPPYVKFIFATTEPDRILATILSRCQRFDLRRIPMNLLVERLKMVCASEKIQADDDAVLAIARMADGGLRDAESALDQLIAFRGDRIAEEDVLSVFGLVARATIESMTETILQGDMPGVIWKIAEIDEAGKDLQRFVLELMGQFRNVLLCQQLDGEVSGLDVMAHQLDVLRKLAGMADTSRVLRCIEILCETENRMRYAISRRVLLETALLRCARAATVVSIEAILKNLGELRASLGQASSSALPEERGTDPGVGVARPAAPGTASKAVPAARGMQAGEELGFLHSRWDSILDAVGKTSNEARRLLRDARPVCVDGDVLKIGFPAEFGAEGKSFAHPHERRSLEAVVSQLLKRAIHVDCTVIDPEGEVSDQGPVVQAKPEEAAPVAKPAAKRLGRDLLVDPAVQKTLEIFGGTIRDVRE